MSGHPTCQCRCPHNHHGQCRQPLPDTAYICAGCATQLRRDLHAAADIAGEATTTIARLNRGEPATGRATTPPLPYDQDAADAQWAIHNTMTTWARHICAASGRTPPALPRGTHPLAALATWLADHADWLRHRPEAADAYDELTDAARLAVRIVDRAPTLSYAGPCQPGTCDTDLYAPRGATTLTCHHCGAVHDVPARLQWLLGIADDQLVHAGWLAAALTALGEPVPAATIRQWAHRGRLTHHGRDQHGRPLYRVGDARALIAASLTR